MDFLIMGRLEVRDGDVDRTPTAPKHRDLLTMFVLNARRPLNVEQLRRLLWPREDGERSDSLVRGYIGQLRRLLGKDVITTVSGTYTLAIREEQLDADRFRRLVERGDHAQALALWRGPALEDVDPGGERWTQTRRLREELEELRLLALERRIEAELNASRHRESLSELRGLVGEYPLWQRFRGLHMLALYRSGRRAEALDAYTRLRDGLDAEHAIEPDSELQLLHYRMLHDDVSLHVAAGPPLLLPRDVAHFTGREELVDRVIGEQVVVHGPAGVGKSALAVHAAWRARERFPDGILYADLRTGGTASVLEDFLRWLGCPARAVPADVARREQVLRTYAANRRVLVVLDNATSEAEVRPLLTAAPTVVTSRSTLAGLTEARRVAVGLLDPADSATLLTALATNAPSPPVRTRTAGGPTEAVAGPSAPGDGGSGAALGRLVDYCGGLPLALRIAGSRLAARPDWSPAYLAGLLDDERLRLDRLHAGDLTVRSVLALGYDGLPEPAQRALCRLGALSAPDFGEWLVGSSADALVDAGLLDPHGIDAAGQLRYRLHSLTRLFARERLGERDVLRELSDQVMARVRLSRFTIVSGDPAALHATRDIRQSVEWLTAERGFLVALVGDLSRAGLHDACRRLAHLLTPFLQRHRLLEDWRAVAQVAVESARLAGKGEAQALRDLADLHAAEGRWQQAHDTLRLSLGLALRAGIDTAPVWRRLGRVQLEQGRLDEAHRTLTRCLTSDGDPRDHASTLHTLGVTAHRAAHREEAEARRAEAHGGRDKAEGRRAEAHGRRHEGELRRAQALGRRDETEGFRAEVRGLRDEAGERRAQARARLDEAAGRLTEARARFADLGERHQQADTLLELAAVRLGQGEVALARQAAQEARGLAIRLGDRLLGAHALLVLAEVNRGEGDAERARELAEEARRELAALPT
ncbi:BTAD domain-containing putative transcriptional regulator [Nonomuraea sp. NPDC050663]|uniref:AfsR/SARP family transcriptional regulator n=1 Tax=Nonomuraea sp. NPDC050663 TaxID=3364370 RepID=UPI0037B865B8